MILYGQKQARTFQKTITYKNRIENTTLTMKYSLIPKQMKVSNSTIQSSHYYAVS